jgi:radical SAM superfamily enzyme YgiQ (UPF0313 family)
MPAVRPADSWLLGTREHSTTISPDRRSVYSFDLEGRPLSWYEDGRVYKRSLSGEVFGRQRVDGRKRYWKLSRDETSSCLDRIRDRLSGTPLERASPTAAGRLRDILRWTPQALLDERERFDAAYRPISILPPDQYLSVVLQASFGCSWNRCTFCSFYQDQPFVARSADDFRVHAGAVRSLLGRGAGMRRSIFLASGNALVMANRRLRSVFHIARELFPGRDLNGFVDVFSGERKEMSDWVELRELGLERVHVGVETGHDPLLRWLSKPGGGEAAADFVTMLKRAGLRVAVIVMVGVGGRRFADEHARASVALVARMPLEKRDIVYLSPFAEQTGSEYDRRARAAGIEPLDADEREVQYRRLREEIRRIHRVVRVTRYDIRESVY